MNRKKHTNYPAIISFCIALTCSSYIQTQKDEPSKQSRKKSLKRSHSVRNSLKTSLKRTQSARHFTQSQSNSTTAKLQKKQQEHPSAIITQEMNPDAQFKLFKQWIQHHPENMIDLLQNIPYNDPRCFIQDANKTSLLHIAAQHEQPTIMFYLLKKGVSMHKKNANGETAFDIAKQHNSKQSAKLIKQNTKWFKVAKPFNDELPQERSLKKLKKIKGRRNAQKNLSIVNRV